MEDSARVNKGIVAKEQEFRDNVAGRKPEDYMFELSMNLHKLCCAIAFLVSGNKCYFVNNRKLYDFPNSYKAFIKIVK